MIRNPVTVPQVLDWTYVPRCVSWEAALVTEKQFAALIERLDKIETDIRTCATKIASVREQIYQQMSLLPMVSDELNTMTPTPAAIEKHENDAAGKFMCRFYDLYKIHRSGARYHLLGRHRPLIRQLLATYGEERLEKLVLVLFKTDEEWIEGTDRGIGILSTKASWLEEKLSVYEAKHGAIKVNP